MSRAAALNRAAVLHRAAALNRAAALRVATALTLLACLPLAACGGSTHRHQSGHPVVVAGTLISTGGLYRWLVKTEGAQPTVTAENGQAGTTAWRRPGPRAQVGGIARGDVTGYVAKEAVRVGQTERIYVGATGSPTVQIRIFRMGLVRGQGRA